MPPSPSHARDRSRLLLLTELTARPSEDRVASAAPQLGPPPAVRFVAHPRTPPLVCLVGPLLDQEAALVGWLREHDFALERFIDIQSLCAACEQGCEPVAVIIDGSGNDAGLQDVTDATRRCGRAFPVIWVSERTDLELRLAAHRAGVGHVLPRSFEPEQIFGLLSELSNAAAQVPLRVLVLSEAPAQVAPLAASIAAAGLELRIEHQAGGLLPVLEAFRPDLLVIDGALQAYDSLELAAVLRADVSSNETLAILLLFDEADAGRLTPAGVGALSRAAGSERLVSAVKSRAQRARRQRQLLIDQRQAAYEREREHLALDQHALVSITDACGVITYANDKFCQTSGYSRAELLGRRHNILKSGQHAASFYRDLWSTIAGGHVWQGELCNRCKDGRLYWVASTITPLLDDNGKPCQYISIRTDITGRKLAEAQLVAAREEAERANRAKSEFLASMSHELRTPMNAILGFGQLLEIDLQLTGKHRDFLREILKGGRHLLDLINDVLDLARVDTGRIDLAFEPVCLGPLVDDCLALAKPLADKRHITLQPLALEGFTVRADRVRLRQVLVNLLSNAIKYNREAGAVVVSASVTEAGLLRLAVHDMGPGIARERLGELFQPFSRLGAEAGPVEGTGIGLVITKRLVELMGGQVGVDSRPGVGSTFWVDLPVGGPMVPNAAPAIAEAPPRQIADPSPPRTVLYIDDNPINLKLVGQIIGREGGLRLLTAHTPRLGIELAEVHRPDLILLDIQMPGMDGYEVLRVLKASDPPHKAPVVALTANAMRGDVARGLAAGFDDYLTKPLDVPRFLGVVRRLLADDRGVQAHDRDHSAQGCAVDR